VLIDPRAPTLHHPGSPGKLAVLRERARAGLCLFHPHDAVGLRHLEDRKTSPSTKRSPLERRIMETIGYQPRPTRELAAQIGCRLTASFRRALMCLREAGVLSYSRRHGWRLVRI
jgi:hypothetical protein